MDYLIGAAVGLTVGMVIAWWLGRLRTQAAVTRVELVHQSRRNEERERLEAEAERKARESATRQTAETESRLARQQQQLEALHQEVERDTATVARTRQQLERREQVLGEREMLLDQRQAKLDRREDKLAGTEEAQAERLQALDDREAELTTRHDEIDRRLEEIAGLDREEARRQLLEALDLELVEEQSRIISRRQAELEARAKEQANELIARAIQRYAAEHSAETTTAKVAITDDDMKGRIIGKEGRNIRTFEQLTGVELIVDDTPGVITISCFDGIRREIARRTLLELVEDGRIHPARIEEVLARMQQDIDREVLKLGEDAAYNVDVSGLHPKLLRLLGKLNYRTSYGQNNLIHTQEVAFLCGALAADLGLDPKLARRCGLMHDIGKALDHEQEGSHPELGAEALRRYGENEVVQNAALAHHEGREVTSIYTVLTAAADAISAARPGARRETAERYLKRLEQLEDIACTFTGVMKAFAIQAGRELRVIVSGHTIADTAMPKVARDIARRIEDEVAYPGEVKVTIIRETRATAVAR